MSTYAIICPSCEVVLDATANSCPNCKAALGSPVPSCPPGLTGPLEGEGCCLTAKDHSLLEALLDRCSDQDDPVRNAVLKKLSEARVVLTDDVDPDVVTLNSHVVFCVDDGGPELRILILGELSNVYGLTLPVTTLRGLSLLGLSEGNEATALRRDGSAERLRVISVPYQPEDARRRGLKPKPTPPRQRAAGGVPAWFDDDDPGPSAA